ncbi:phage portal protein [Dyadobacter endophyticus]|uniref:phage portal protein n=1 Tax=Dyadobacter endophyticus TaxID=1749036 RepID=UPI003CEDF3E5
MRLKYTNARLCILSMREVFDAYLKRRLNIIKAFVGMMDKTLAPAAKKLRIDAEIVPYIIQDDMERMNMLITANGGKAVISQKTSVGRSGLVSDPAREFELLQAEQKAG